MTRDVSVQLVGDADRDAVVAYLSQYPLSNLLLLDVAARLGAAPAPGEMRGQVAVAQRNGAIIGVAGLRPSVAFDSAIAPEALEALHPFLESLGIGLLKSAEGVVDVVWQQLARRGRRRAIVDRLETAYALRGGEPRLVSPPDGALTRAARSADLDRLVIAARESLREEHRPDPFAGDIRGFRRWVRGRIPRARVVELEGRLVFVGYADVQRPEGWLVQGVYTFPEVRGRGFATAGVSALCQEAFGAGADHVQLAVVDGNLPGQRLYEGLGFKPFEKLRTILFIEA